MKQNVNEMKVFSADLETDREALRRHVASKEAELEKAHVAMSEMDREIGVLKDRCHRSVSLKAPRVLYTSVFCCNTYKSHFWIESSALALSHSSEPFNEPHLL